MSNRFEHRRKRIGVKTSWVRAKAALRAMVAVAIAVTPCCFTAGSEAFPPVEGLVARGSELGASEQALLERGRVLAITECHACHRLYRPREYAPPEWRAIARRMGARSGLDRQQVRELEAYLVLASRHRDRPAMTGNVNADRAAGD